MQAMTHQSTSTNETLVSIEKPVVNVDISDSETHHTSYATSVPDEGILGYLSPSSFLPDTSSLPSYYGM